jgi:ribosomal protein L16 Arg81 hydroxylase
MNFWIGQNGTTADTHYDGYENFNVQIYGKKRWLVFAPDQPLYLYPFVHPSHAQTQVSIDDPELQFFPKVKQATAMEVSSSLEIL